MPDPRSFNRPLLLALALAIGLAVPIAERLIFAAALHRSIDLSEPDVLAMNAVIVAIPFIVLNGRRSAHALPWLTALALTIGLHWWWLAKGIAYQRAPDGSGVDMFGALVMLVSPVPITLLALATRDIGRGQNAR